MSYIQGCGPGLRLLRALLLEILQLAVDDVVLCDLSLHSANIRTQRESCEENSIYLLLLSLSNVAVLLPLHYVVLREGYYVPVCAGQCAAAPLCSSHACEGPRQP